MLLRGFSRRRIRDSRGNIGVMTALLIVPLVGALGLATEGASWFLINRVEQNAADSAALAAAGNGDAGNGNTYVFEARAVAAKYGFINGVQGPNLRVAIFSVMNSYRTLEKVSNSAKTDRKLCLQLCSRQRGGGGRDKDRNLCPLQLFRNASQAEVKDQERPPAPEGTWKLRKSQTACI